MTQIIQHMQALGVDWGASPEQVKAARRAAVSKAHPDLVGATGTEQMARVNAAYDALKTGVPGRPARTRAGQSGSSTRSPATTRSVLRPKPDFGRFTRRYDVLDRDREGLERSAKSRLALNAVVPAPSWFERMILRRPPTTVMAPSWMTTHCALCEIGFDTASVRQGQFYLVVPELSIFAGKITILGIAQIIRIQHDGSGFDRLKISEPVRNKIAPRDPWVQVALSNSCG